MKTIFLNITVLKKYTLNSKIWACWRESGKKGGERGLWVEGVESRGEEERGQS